MIDKKLTFKFFDYKWSRVPRWAKATEEIYRKWYLLRYGYENFNNLKKFLANKVYILDAGCGLGRDMKMFAEADRDIAIVGIDQSEPALSEARKALKGYKNCVFYQNDIINFKQPRGFDFISCDQVLHHTPEPNKTLKNLFDKLVKGGIINFSVCRLKNKYRDLADDLIMKKATKMSPDKLWRFAEKVTRFAKELYELDINDVWFENKKYDNLQRFVHDNLFRTWYNPDIPFELSVSSNYDWFSGNPRFSKNQVQDILRDISHYSILRFYEDDATISVSLKKL